MSTIIIKSDNKEDLKLFKELAKRLGLSTKILTDEEKEDAALLSLMKKAMKGKNVSESSIMKRLNS